MSLRINDEAPNFTAQTTQGEIDFHQWIGDGWAILFSHPKDFTPVCTTELGYMAKLEPDFAAGHCKVIGLSVDPVSSHGKWAADIEETQGHAVTYPMIAIQLWKWPNCTICYRPTPAIRPKAALRPPMPPCAPCSSSVRIRKSS